MRPPAPAPRRRVLLGLAAAPLLLAAGRAAAARPVPVPVPAPPGRAAAAAAARPNPAPAPVERAVALRHLHTGEAARLVYRAGDRYLPEALRTADRLLRDWRAGRASPTDPALLDLLWDLGRRLGTGDDAPVEILCGYRTPETNALLRRRSGGRRSGVARDSLHTRGMAVDVRIPGRPLPAVRAAALGLGRGGVGYYPDPGSGFVHLDTGPPRRW